ncbi:WRKY domain-containing protein [Psidium guajava]|nr:WRKY domain-containing protein [Psidium guajava]
MKSLIDDIGRKCNIQRGLSAFVPRLSFVGARTQLSSNST